MNIFTEQLMQEAYVVCENDQANKFIEAFKQFVLQDNGKQISKYVGTRTMQAYVRLTKHYINGEPVSTIDIANVSFPSKLQGQGIFKQMIEVCRLSKLRQYVYVESILNPEFLKHFQNPANGWTLVQPSNGYAESYYKKL